MKRLLSRTSFVAAFTALQLLVVHPLLATGPTITPTTEAGPYHPLDGGDCFLNAKRNWHIGSNALNFPTSAVLKQANDHGSVVGYKTNVHNNPQAFEFEGHFGPDGNFYVGGFEQPAGLFTEQAGSFLPFLSGTQPSASSSYAYDINNAGSIVGSASTNELVEIFRWGPYIIYQQQQNAVIWENGSVRSLSGTNPSIQSTAFAISAEGHIAGVDAWQPVVWRYGQTKSILTKPDGFIFNKYFTVMDISDGSGHPDAPIIVAASAMAPTTGSVRIFAWEEITPGVFSDPIILDGNGLGGPALTISLASVNNVGYGQIVGTVRTVRDGTSTYIPVVWDRSASGQWIRTSLETDQPNGEGKNIVVMDSNDYGMAVGVRTGISPSVVSIFQSGIGWSDLTTGLDPDSLGGKKLNGVKSITNSGRIIGTLPGEFVVIEPTYYKLVELIDAAFPDTNSEGVDINDSAQVVSYEVDQQYKTGFVWLPSEPYDTSFHGTFLDPSYDTHPVGIASDGRVFGSTTKGTAQIGTIWSNPNFPTSTEFSCAKSITSVGATAIVGDNGTTGLNVTNGCGGRGGSAPALNLPSGVSSSSKVFALDSNEGNPDNLVGYAIDGAVRKAVYWDAVSSSGQVLDLPAGLSSSLYKSYATAINQDGSLIAGYAVDNADNERALIWAGPGGTRHDFQTLRVINASGVSQYTGKTRFTDINRNGFAVGKSTRSVSQLKSKLDNSTVTTTGVFLNPEDWSAAYPIQDYSRLVRVDKFVVEELRAVNNNGVVVGTGRKISIDGNPENNQTAFVAIPPFRGSWACLN